MKGMGISGQLGRSLAMWPLCSMPSGSVLVRSAWRTRWRRENLSHLSRHATFPMVIHIMGLDWPLNVKADNDCCTIVILRLQRVDNRHANLIDVSCIAFPFLLNRKSLTPALTPRFVSCFEGLVGPDKDSAEEAHRDLPYDSITLSEVRLYTDGSAIAAVCLSPHRHIPGTRLLDHTYHLGHSK